MYKNNRNFKCILEQRVCQSNKPALFVYSIGDCPPQHSYDDRIRKKCEKSNKLEKFEFKTSNNSDIFLQWPFYSNQTSTTYNNIYCGLCNGEKREHLQPWPAAFRCHKDKNQQLKNVSAQAKMNEVKSNCFFVKWMSDFMNFRYCRPNLINKCLKSNNSLDNIKCAKGEYNIHYKYNNGSGEAFLFRNKFCAECSGFKIDELSCDKKKLPTDQSKFSCSVVDVTWSILFDFNFFTGEYRVGFNKFKNEILTSKCDKDSFYDPFLKQCRQILLGKTKDFIDFFDCKSIKTYNSNEFSLLDDSSIFLIHENIVLNSSYYKYSSSNDTVTTCTYLFSNKSMTSDSDTFLFLHDALTKLGITLSISGLSVLLIIYLSFSKLRNLPGLNLICLCVSYITVYFVIISSIILMKYTKDKVSETSKLETIYDWSFYILAVLLNYACLSTYSWMTIISYDICRTFMANSFQRSFKDNTVRHRLFIRHLIVGFGIIPLVPVAFALIIDNFHKQSAISPQYAGIGKNFRIAWFSNRLGLLVFYIIPVAIMLGINITFFLVTIVAIWRTDASIEEINFKAENHSETKTRSLTSTKWNKNSKRTDDVRSLKTKTKMILFTKLLCIMGLSWMLSFMASFIDQKWIYLLDTIVNAFQGLFISLIFIFNRKVLKLLKK